MDKEKYKERIRLDHNLRIYIGTNITVYKIDGDMAYGRLLWVEYDKERIEFYLTLFFNERAIRIYENDVDRIIPDYQSSNEVTINTVRTMLAEKYILWDGGIITPRNSTFPVVNLIDTGSKIRVDYCTDLSAEDIAFSETYETQSADEIVIAIESIIKKYEQKSKRFDFFRYFPRWKV